MAVTRPTYALTQQIRVRFMSRPRMTFCSVSAGVPVFHRQVLAVPRNNRRDRRLATVPAIEHIGVSPATGPRGCVPKSRRMNHGTLYQRHQNHERPVRAPAAGHLLRREAAREGAAKQLVKALPKMAEKATDKQLKQGFLTHLDETKIHVQRLEQVFQMHGAEVKAVNCPAIDGIIKDCLLYTS